MSRRTRRRSAAGGNRDLAVAMQNLRRSNAATRHRDRHADRRKGFGKGGRAGGRRAALDNHDDDSR